MARRRGDAVDVRIASRTNRSLHLKLDSSPVTLQLSRHGLSKRRPCLVLSFRNDGLLLSPLNNALQVTINGSKLVLQVDPTNRNGDSTGNERVNYMSPTISYLINSRTTQLLKEKSK